MLLKLRKTVLKVVTNCSGQLRKVLFTLMPNKSFLSLELSSTCRLESHLGRIMKTLLRTLLEKTPLARILPGASPSMEKVVFSPPEYKTQSRKTASTKKIRQWPAAQGTLSPFKSKKEGKQQKT